MTDRNQIKDIFLAVEFVNDSVIAGAQPVLGSAFQPSMRKIGQVRTQVSNLRFRKLANVRWKFQKSGIKLARINFRRLAHASFG